MPMEIPEIPGPEPAPDHNNLDALPSEAPGQPTGGESPVTAKDLDMFSQRFAKLSETESSIREQREGLQKEMEEFKQYREEVDRWKKAKALKEENPIAYLEQEGLTYEELTEKVVNSKEYEHGAEFKAVNDTIKGLQTQLSEALGEIKSFKEEQAQKKQEESERQNSEQAQKYLDEFHSFVEEAGDEYEFIKTYGNNDVVLQMAIQYYEKHGKMAELQNICKHYEGYLEKSLDEQYNKFKNLKKFSKFGGQQQSDFEPQFNLYNSEPTHNTERVQAKTLNSDFNNSNPPVSKNRPLTREQSITEAAKLIRFME